MSGTKQIRFGGLGFVSTTKKTLDRSTKYDHLFPQPDWKQRIVRRDGLVTDVVADMKDVIFSTRKLTKEFAPYMRGRNIYETCRNVWEFWYNRCAYHEDQRGLEQLRTPNRSYWEGAGYEPGGDPDEFGIDCDDFSICVSQTLLNLHIPHYLRIARYPLVDFFQHVYVIVPYAGRYIYVDCVLDAFDEEKYPEETKDFLIMDKHNLNGIDVAVLSGIGDSAPLLDVVTGSDFYSLSGLGEPNDEGKELEALYNHLKKTRDLVAENPELVKEAEHPEQFLEMLDYALKYWNTDKRAAALAVLAANENKANQLRGFCPGADTSESEIQVRALSGGGYSALGKIGGERKFFNKVKEAAEKAGQGIKKAATAAVKYNPLTVAARAGLLLALKTNLFHMGDHLKWGYLSEKDAKENGFDMAEWRKSKEALDHTHKMFKDILQGDENHLKSSILTGRAGGLSSVNIGSLGIEPVTTATTTAAATGFIAKIQSWVKGIDLKKMLQKVNLSKLTDKLKSQAPADNQLPAAGDGGQDSGSGSGGNSGGSNSRDAEDDGSNVWPWIAAAGLGVLLLSSSNKKKSPGYSGLGSTKTGKKKRRKKSQQNVSGFESHFPPDSNYAKHKKKKGGYKSKIKKMTLR